MKEYLILRLRNAAIAMDRKGDPNMAALLTEAINELEKHDVAQSSVVGEGRERELLEGLAMRLESGRFFNGVAQPNADIYAQAIRAALASKASAVTVGEPIWQDIQGERLRQDVQWGGATHDDQHAPDDFLGYISRQVALGLSERAGPEHEARMMRLSIDKVGPMIRAAMRTRFVKIAALSVAAMQLIGRLDGDSDTPPAPIASSEDALYTMDQMREYADNFHLSRMRVLVAEKEAYERHAPKPEPYGYAPIHENGNYFTRNKSTADYVGGMMPVYAAAQPSKAEVLEEALVRMDRARNILTDGNLRPECNWGILDTADLRARMEDKP